MTIEKPSQKEDEYFTKQELEKKKQWEKERAAKMEQAERERLKELHQMKCPKCGMDLHNVEMKGVTLDRCVSCNGTWFDDGELEAILKGDAGVLGKVMSIFR